MAAEGYVPPLREIEYSLYEIADFEAVARLRELEEATPDLVRAVLEEAGRFASGALAPLDRVGDREGARLEGNDVVTAAGWPDAYREFVDAGWAGLVFPTDCGGQGLPWTVAAAVDEIWHSANMAFALNPMLTRAAANAVRLYGTPRQRERFLPPLVAGCWTGTMNLTEPQAGSDLSAVRCRAVPAGDHYLISGQKIFITYGDHDLAENIVHMVLARLPDAPAGLKGISMFMVPKFRVGETGAPGERNSVRCVSLEDKLGIHGSPTCTIVYENAQGHLLGEPARGIEYMFTMMNESRLAVGVQGLGVAERAFQKARSYARERIQGRPWGAKTGDAVPIVRHGDVRRMLMTMKALIEAMRGLAHCVAAWLDLAEHHPEAAARKRFRTLVELLTPVVKGWCTERCVEIASTAIQVHGGSGYIEETGIARHLRDARVTTIYEGTTGIQANDLLGRKLIRDGGAGLGLFLETMEQTFHALTAAGHGDLADRFRGASKELKKAGCWLLEHRESARRLSASTVPFLMLLGDVAGGWVMGKSAAAASAKLSAAPTEGEFYRTRLALARFYAEHILPHAAARTAALVEGADSVFMLEEENF